MHDVAAVARVCEAILAVAGEPVSAADLAEACGDGIAAEVVEAALGQVRCRHDVEGSGLMLEKVGGGWRLATRPDLDDALRGYLRVRSRSKLSQAALETLAIVAYRQPVTLPEISFLRGVNSAGVLRTLCERGLVRAAGRKRVVGTPLLYRTSSEFLIQFGLDDLAALPSPDESPASED